MTIEIRTKLAVVCTVCGASMEAMVIEPASERGLKRERLWLPKDGLIQAAAVGGLRCTVCEQNPQGQEPRQ